MKQTVFLHTFREEFKLIRPDNFSYEGLQILYDYLTDLEDSIGEELELDVIAICCDYAEDTASNIASQYDIDLSSAEDDPDEELEIVKEFLENEGAFCGIVSEEGTIVYRCF